MGMPLVYASHGLTHHGLVRDKILRIRTKLLLTVVPIAVTQQTATPAMAGVVVSDSPSPEFPTSGSNERVLNAGDGRVSVVARWPSDSPTLTITDQALSFDATSATDEVTRGAMVMREGAPTLGGRMYIDSSPSMGTRLALTLRRGRIGAGK